MRFCLFRGKFDIDAWFELDGCDLFDFALEAFEIDDSFEDSHFESVKCIGTLTTWGFSDGDFQNLGWHSDRSLNLDFLEFFGSGNNFGANYHQERLERSGHSNKDDTFFDSLHIFAGKGDTGLDLFSCWLSFLVLCIHFGNDAVCKEYLNLIYEKHTALHSHSTDEQPKSISPLF